MRSDYDPLGLAELEPSVLGSVQEERANAKKSVKVTKDFKESSKRQKEVIAAMEATPVEPVAPPPPPPEVLRAMVDKINAYKERFTNLKSRNKVTFKSTYEEIEDELHYVELQLGSSTQSGNFGAAALCTVMTCIERSTEYYNPLNLDLRGLGSVTKQNMHEFQPIIDELLIKYNTGLYTPPEIRLVLAIGATVVTVNAANQNPEVAKAVRAMHKTVSKPPGSDAM
jgi:hypothetical protein